MNRKQLIETLIAAKRDIEPGQDVEVGLFRPEDALGVSLAYYETYGDAFPLDLVYDPEEIVRRNATDNQYTVVARTARGEIVGMAGLFRNAPNPDVYETGQLMVLKAYRNSHIAGEISKYMMNRCIRALGIPTVFMEGVCNHPVSQRLAIQERFSPTGLEVECMPAKTYEEEGGVQRNVSLLLMFNVQAKSPGTVHVPDEYRKIVDQTYSELEISRTLGAGGDPQADATESSVFQVEDAKLVRLTVKGVGNDFASVVEKAEGKFGDSGLTQIYLNLGDSGAPGAVTKLRERGYFYGGLLPNWFGPDGLVVQKVPLKPDWEAMRLYGKKAKAIHAYVRSDYDKVAG